MKFYKIGLVFLLLLCPILALSDGTDTAYNYTAGTNAGENLETDSTGEKASNNTLVGVYAGRADTTGKGNTGVGYGALSRNYGSGCIGLGFLAGDALTASDHKLYINTGYYPTNGIFGDFSTGYFGINNTSPAVALDVTGSMAVSGTMGFSVGTAAAPSIYFGSDTDTGLFSVTAYANRVGISAKGTTAAVVDTAGVMAITSTSVRLSQYSDTSDSSLTVTLSSGVPAINFFGTDDDTYSISINTSDQALFSGASGGYDFDTYVGADSLVIRPGAVAANTLFRGKSSDGTSVATIDTVGAMQIGRPYNGNISFIAVNNDSTNTSATANVKAFANWGGTSILAHGKGRTSERYGHQIGNWGTIEMDATSTYTGANGLIIGTRCAKPILFGINDTFAVAIDSVRNVGIGEEVPSGRFSVKGTIGGSSTLINAKASDGTQVFSVDSLGVVTADTLNVTNSVATGYSIVDGAFINRGGMSLTGSLAKGIDFSGITPPFSDSDDAYIAIGTWNDALTIRGQTQHFVPIQVHLHTRTNVAKDIAAARFRVDTDSTVTDAAIGCLQLRQSLAHPLASSAILNASVSVSDSVVVGTGSLLGGYFSIEGSGYIRKAGDNDCTPLVAVNNNTGALTVDNVFIAMQNGTGTTVDEIVKIISEHGTATVGLSIAEGTSGTIGTDISLQNSETISNTQDGKIDIGGVARITGVSSTDSLTIWNASDGTTVADMDSLGVLSLKQVNADTLNVTNLVATGYGIVDGAGIVRGGLTVTGIAAADTINATNSAVTGYSIVDGAFIGRSGATITGNGSFTGYVSQFYNVQAIVADSVLTSAAMPSGSIITNGAATVTIEVTLPTAVSGLTYKFVTTDTDSLIVIAGASDTITDSAAASLADYAAVGQVGETVELVAISDAVWQVMNKTGTWAAR